MLIKCFRFVFDDEDDDEDDEREEESGVSQNLILAVVILLLNQFFIEEIQGLLFIFSIMDNFVVSESFMVDVFNSMVYNLLLREEEEIRRCILKSEIKIIELNIEVSCSDESQKKGFDDFFSLDSFFQFLNFNILELKILNID